MVGFIVYQRWDGEETKKLVEKIEAWFAQNPKRRVCRVDCGGVHVKARKKHIKEDVIAKIGTDYNE